MRFYVFHHAGSRSLGLGVGGVVCGEVGESLGGGGMDLFSLIYSLFAIPPTNSSLYFITDFLFCVMTQWR